MMTSYLKQFEHFERLNSSIRPAVQIVQNAKLAQCPAARPGETMIRIAVPDLISNSYFPAVAAVELGFFKSEGLDASIDLLFPVPKTYAALRDGDLDFVVGSAHATLLAFPDWQGAKLLAAVAQHTYWFLVIRSDLKPKHGDLSVVKGLRIGAAPGVNLSLQRLLVEADIDPERDNVQIVPIPGAAGPNVSFGLSAAKA